MRCPLQENNPEMLLSYCSRKLDWESGKLVEKHIEVCPECRSMAEGQRAVWEALDAWEAMPVSRDFDRRLYRRIDEEDAARGSWLNWLIRPVEALRMRPAVGVAAVCATLFAVFLVRGPDTTAGGFDPGAAAGIEAQDIEQAERALEDIEMLRQLGPVAQATNPDAHHEL